MPDGPIVPQPYGYCTITKTDNETPLLVDRLQEFFPDAPALIGAEPFSLGLLASQSLTARDRGR